MNDDAFARRFYADRAELEALGIELRVDRAVDGFYEAENYSLPPENFYLPSVQFTDRELASLTTALKMLDGQFAYAEPLRLALQQLTWGRPSPLSAPDETSIHVAVGPDVEGRELSQRLCKIENAIFRRKTIIFDYLTIGRGVDREAQGRPVPPALPRRPVLHDRPRHERDEQRMFKLSRIQRQDQLRQQGRARLPAARGLRPARVRDDGRVAVRPGRRSRPRSGSASASHGSSSATSPSAGTIRNVARGEAVPGKGVIFETDFTDVRAADLMGARPWTARSRARAGRPCRRRRRSASRGSPTDTTASSRSRRRSRVVAAPAPAPALRPTPRPRSARALRPPDHAGRNPDRRDAHRRDRLALPAGRGPQRPARRDRGGHRSPQRRQLRRRQLRAVRADRGRRDLASTASPTATTSPALPVCFRSRPRR